VHDPLNVGDLVEYEYHQRRESGFDVSGIQAPSAAIPADDPQRLESIYLELTRTVRAPGWRYQEPNQLPDILAAMPARSTADPARAAPGGLADRIHGGWLGRIAGCNLGKPVEDGAFWTSARLRTYLELAGAYPLRDYVPALDPMPEGFRLRECWPETTRGLVRGSARDDDIDYSILALWLVEQHGFELTTSQVADALLANLPYARVFTAERTALVNLLHNVPIAQVGETRNPYREWIGAQIRADVFGWVLPGRPRTAAGLVFRDAFLTHRGNGIYAAMWAAALVSLACAASTVHEAVEQSLDYVPAGSRLAEALSSVHDLYRKGCAWEAAI
jgi:ADP-ribosylglycohydrolase